MFTQRYKVCCGGNDKSVDFTSGETLNSLVKFYKRYPQNKKIFEGIDNSCEVSERLKFLIERRFERNLNKILNEEEGVNSQVNVETEEIGEKILTTYRSSKNKFMPYSQTDNRPTLRMKFTCDVLGDAISFKCTFIQFNNDNEILAYCDQYSLGANIDLDNKTVEVVCAIINGEIQIPDLMDAIQHELIHFYQYKLMHRFAPEEAEKRYHEAMKEGDKHPYGTNQRAISDLVYIMNGQEVTAYVNGLYAYLTHNPYFVCGDKKQKWNVYVNSHFYKCFFEFKANFERVEKVKYHQGIQDYAISHYNETIFVILKRADKMLKTMEEKGHKVFYKALQDIKHIGKSNNRLVNFTSKRLNVK